MKISKEVTIRLTPEEASDIIKTHLNRLHTDVSVENISFSVTTVYDKGSGYDDRGSEEVTEIVCKGYVK
jgi:hypothetical protein